MITKNLILKIPQVFSRKKSDHLRHYFDLILVMTEKEIKTRYKKTVFGFLWVVINPVLQMLVIGFVFRFFISRPIDNYYLYLLTGLLVWNFFSLSLTKATPSIINERSLIKKAKFPLEVIPLSIILSNLINLFVSFSIILIGLLMLSDLSLINVLILIAGFVLLLLFTVGFSLITTALNVRFRDINFFVQALLIIWFYATPVIYSLSMISQEFVWIWRINPFTSIIQLFQHSLVNSPAPDTPTLVSNLLIISLTVVIGIAVFKNQSKTFDDWL